VGATASLTDVRQVSFLIDDTALVKRGRRMVVAVVCGGAGAVCVAP
jgi:hypothetical protein